jgi:hypothetical protein
LALTLRRTVPNSVLVLDMENGQVISPAPDDLEALQSAPDWSKSIVEATLRGELAGTDRPLASPRRDLARSRIARAVEQRPLSGA